MKGFDNLAICERVLPDPTRWPRPPGFSFNEVQVKRVEVIVDGLNLLHCLSEQSPHVEYLDLLGLIQRLVNQKSETLVAVRYFTAVANHISDWGQEKQKRFLASLQQDLVSIRFGHFNQTRNTCQRCGAKSNRHSEKQTDVGFATALIQGAYENSYDKVLLFSADSCIHGSTL